MSAARIADGEGRGPLLTTRALEVGYGREALLPPIDLEINAGEFWAVLGRNGSGKSTWLRTLLGLVAPVRGSLAMRPGLKLAYLPQMAVLDTLYPLTARDVVGMGCLRGRVFVPPDKKAKRAVEAALRLMGATDIADEPYRKLSEGQRQRVRFARVAASQADLAFLDEPTSAMDLVAEREAFEWLGALRRETSISVVVISHYVQLALQFADHAVLLDRDTPAVVAGAPRLVAEHPSFLARYGATGALRPAQGAPS